VTAPRDEQPQLGAWLERRADGRSAVLHAALDGGLIQVTHVEATCYFVIRRWRVLTLAARN
jgi:hypothetical protein